MTDVESLDKADVTAGVLKGRFLRRLDWSAFWTATAISFVVYFYTLAPTVTLEDSGELAVAGDYLGVPHPPGYPIWSLFAWIFSRIFSFVTYLGQPNPSWSIGLMSAVFGALATGVTAMLICRSGSDLLSESHHTLGEGRHGDDDAVSWIAGVSASLLFAFSPCMWSQAVIVEVYSLNALFIMLIFLLVYGWMRKPDDRLLYCIAFLFGLGLTNYQALLLAALALLVAVVLRDLSLARDFAILGAPYLVVIYLIKAGAIPPIRHPSDPTCFVYMSLNALALILAWFLLPRGRTVALSFLFAEIGIAFYAYMPIVSDLRNPPMNWGYPRTWAGFKHAVSRGQYEKIAPTDMFSVRFVHQIGTFLSDLRRNFTLPLAVLGFLPFAAWQVRLRERRVQALYVAVPLVLLATVFVAIEKAIPGGAALAARMYKLLILGVILILGVGAVHFIVAQFEEYLKKALGRIPAPFTERITAGLVLLGALGGYGFYVMMLTQRLVLVTAPLRSVGSPLAAEKIQDVFTGSAGIVAAMLAPAIALAVVVWLARGRLRLTATIAHIPQKWIVATVFGYVAMGIVFIALANLKMDIQDTFIQRVKFISSHGLYALWIGYGILFGLALTDAVFKKHRAVQWLCLGAAALLPLMPLLQNAYNDELIRVYGGAEQNGHDFGWQFGNYQLRGAEAISEELSPDEEPLPDPSFPSEMGQDAIFFGGTDPGRFVPTYMIYSARVREDVYLITQNALADNTYMSVMRDLYGDQIWIPAQPDSARAFQRYVTEVRSGKRPKNAQLKIENGRVQVSGALGVMEINGILAQMIFEHNNYKHDFYVEESYVIPWMFPYMTPHGLIMQIHPKHTPLSPKVIRDDQVFWDWYTRRLYDNPAFRRDVTARKSFSKLRSAIGGLYRSRAKLAEAENAFQQARILYPLSPEANFRLSQEVLLPLGRIPEARHLMEQFQGEDPANTKVKDFLDHLSRIEGLKKKIAAIESQLREGKLEVLKALELANLYRQVGQPQRFMQMVMSIVNNKAFPPLAHFRAAQLLSEAKRHSEMITALDLAVDRLPPETPAPVLLDAAKMYAKAGKAGKALAMMQRYAARNPNDWNAWLNTASLQIQMGRKDDAARSLEQAVRTGGTQARQVIVQDKRFAAVYSEAASRKRNLIGIPGVTPPRRPGP